MSEPVEGFLHVEHVPREVTTIRNLLYCINVLLVIITLVALFVAYHLVELDRFLIAFGSAFKGSFGA